MTSILKQLSNAQCLSAYGAMDAWTTHAMFKDGLEDERVPGWG